MGVLIFNVVPILFCKAKEMSLSKLIVVKKIKCSLSKWPFLALKCEILVKF
jgi:hypothetical protein